MGQVRTGNSFVEGQGGRYERPLHHSAFDWGLAGNPSQSSHFLGQGKAKGLSSDLQWQTRCDQALLSAANPRMQRGKKGTPSPRRSFSFGNARCETVCAATSSSGNLGSGRLLGTGEGDRSGERPPEGGQSGRRGEGGCARAPARSHPPGRAPALTLRGWGELPASGDEGSGRHCRRRGWPCNLLLPHFRFPRRAG